jgi:two-component system response regulator VicR
MVSARDGEIDIVKGFQVGADHYITKPFHSKELAARVKAVMRRSIPAAGPATPCYQMEDLVIDTEHRMVTVGDKEVLLTATEFTLLEYLARNAGFVLTIDQILQNVWGEGYMGDDVALVNTAVSRLRQKLGDNAREPKYIFTRPGIGYTMRKSQ